ncbi:MAG: GTP cyclohydrolase I [Myxococcota bacterium]
MTGSRQIDLAAAADAIDVFLRSVGAPMDDPELRGTGARVALAFAEDLLSGYEMDPREILADFTASDSRGPVILRDIAATTICPHHLMPATGVVHVGYLPGSRVVGFGSLAKLVDCFSRRLALQEDIGQHVVGALVNTLGARAACCVADLDPTCVTARGGRRHGARAVTVATAGDAADVAQLSPFMMGRGSE